MIVRRLLIAVTAAALALPSSASAQQRARSGAADLSKAKLRTPTALKDKAPETYKATFDTSAGAFVIDVHRDWAPNEADRFYNLVKYGFFDDCRFFRVIPNFMVQFGINGNPVITKAWKNATMKDD